MSEKRSCWQKEKQQPGTASLYVLAAMFLVFVITAAVGSNNFARGAGSGDNDTVKLTLQEAQDRVIEKSRQVKKGELGQEQLDIAVNRAKSALGDIEDAKDDLEDDRDDLVDKYRDLRGMLAKEKMDKEKRAYMEFQLEQIPEQLSQISDQLDDLEEEEDEASLMVEETKQGRELGGMEWEATQKTIMFGAESTYINLLSFKEQKSVVEDGVESLQRLLKEEKARKELDKSTPVQVKMVELEKIELENTLKALEEDYRNMERDFLDNLGYSMDKSLKLNSDTNLGLQEFYNDLDLEEKMNEALEEGKEMEIARRGLEYAEENMEWAKDIYSYGTNDYREREIELKEARIDKEEAKQSLIKEINKAFSSFNQSYRDINRAQMNVEVQKELYSGEELRHELDMSTSRQLLDALVELESAKRELEQEKYQAYLEKRKLELLRDGYLIDGVAPAGMGENEDAGFMETPDGPGEGLPKGDSF